MVGGAEIGVPPHLWPRKPFFAFCTHLGHGCDLPMGVLLRVTGFFSLILLLNFPSGAFRGLYLSSVSPVGMRKVATLPFRLG